jgi:creatinine amidohydrolase
MNIDELYDPEFRKLIKSKRPTIIIPVGSIEQHGAHLPISTDSDIVTEIASRLAKKCGFIVFPTISYGVSFEHDPLFNTSIDEEILSRMIIQICDSLIQSVIPKIIILNGHHGNIQALKIFEEELSSGKLAYSTRKLSKKISNSNIIRFFNYWEFMKHEFDHAGFVETSLMLAISNKVKMKKAKKGLITKGLSEKEKKRISKLSAKVGGFPQVTKNGVWGDPTGATKKDGQKLIVEIVRNLAKKCQS